MTPVINMVPDGQYSIKDIDALLAALESRVQAREVMHRQEAADYLGINVRTLDRMSKRGELPFHQLKGLEVRLFLRSELIAFIKKH
jgi:excisionase family DNA binding protein